MRGKKQTFENGLAPSPDDESRDSNLAQRQRAESLAAIREGLADIEAGRTYLAEEVLRQLFDSLLPGHQEDLCS